MSDFNMNNEEGQERGLHETWENRDACTVRYRNEGVVWHIQSGKEILLLSYFVMLLLIDG